MKSVALLVLAALVVAPSSLLAQSRATDTNAAEKEQKATSGGKSSSSVQPKDGKELLDFIRLESSSVSAATLRKAEFVIRAMVGSRLKLRSGVFRANGMTRQGTSPDGGGPFTLYSLFDNKDDRLRFDLTSFEDVNDEYRIVQSKFSRTPERTLKWGNHNPLRLIVDTPEVKPIGSAIAFDVRAIGLTGPGGLRGTSMGTLTGACEALVKDVKVIGVEERDRIIRIDLQARMHESISSSLWVDSRRGYSPIRAESRFGNLKPYRSVTDVYWVKISDTWVPSTIAIETHRMGKREDRLEMELSWESVNGAVNQRLFTKEELGLSEDTEVVRRVHGDVSSEVVLGNIRIVNFEEAINAR